MTIYLEYKDEKSAKFWTITLQDLSHTVTYGKLGTTGQSKTKTFDTAEQAKKDLEKLVKAKTKKGYQEVANTTTTETPATTPSSSSVQNPPVVLLEEEEAVERFNFMEYELLGDPHYESIWLIDGDFLVEGSINENTFGALFFDGEQDAAEGVLIIVNGNLTVQGDIDISEEYPCLLVVGDLHCEVLHGYDSIIYVTGDAYIQYVYNGNYNHGGVQVDGTTHVPYLLNSDHCSTLNPSSKTILINYYNNQDDFFTYDYYSSDLATILVKGLATVEDEEEDAELEIESFIARVKSGKSPFKKGVKPSRVLVEQELKKLAKKSAATGGIKELDLTEKKLLNLPLAIFELKDLEVLKLEKNSFDNIPSAIGQLTKLKELNLKSTPITALPESIGQLQQLEVLHLSYCPQLKALPKAIGELKNLKKLILWGFKGTVPESITQLDNLEVLDYRNIYSYGVEPVEFPTWITQLKGLKVLDVSENSFKNLPQELQQLSKLEVLTLSGSLCYVQEIPDLSSLSHLKELHLSGSSNLNTRPPVSQDILQDFFSIPSLTKLNISSFGAKEEWMPTSTVEEKKMALLNKEAELIAFESKLRINDSGNYFYQTRRPMQLEDFKGLDQLTQLQELDLGWNDLEELPPEILTLKQLQKVRIYGNNFSKEAKEALLALNPAMVLS